MTVEMRSDAGEWGNLLPLHTVYDAASWSSDLQQQTTPYGPGWVDGTGRAQQGQLKVTLTVSKVTRRACDRECDRVMRLLRTGTAIRDPTRSRRYLITQGVLGAPEIKTHRGECARTITVTLALRDPYWHVADDDSSTATFPTD